MGNRASAPAAPIVGRNEVDIRVEDNTHIAGAIIATREGSDLTLDTGTLSFEEIHDTNKGSEWHAGVTVADTA